MSSGPVVRTARRRAGAVALIACLGSLGCSLTTGTDGDVADVAGTWHYTGEQNSPALSLDGTLLIATQNGDVISGQLSWQEQAPGGGVATDGGPVSGRVIGSSDVDFDVLRAATERRHVGRITADTIRGGWIEISTGRSGTFLAVRSAP